MKYSEIVQAELCIGCGLCVGQRLAKEMVLGHNGFLEPAGTNQHRFDVEDLCAGYKLEHKEKIEDDPVWGACNGIFVANSTNSTIRHQASSGGVVSAIAIGMLRSKLVDGVIHVVPNDDNPLDNRATISATEADVLRGASSRYAPASVLHLLTDELLDGGGRYLLIGKPCDIGALRNLQKCDKRWEKVIPYSVAIFCAGIPSTKGTLEVVRKMGLVGPATKIRYRGEGWPGLFRAWNKDGESVATSYEDSWGETLNRHLHSRCKICPDGIGLQADFAIGDAWETMDGYPDFSNREGSSLVLVRNEMAIGIFQKFVEDGHIAVSGKKNIEYLGAVQKFQAQRRVYFGYRVAGWTLAGGMLPRFSGLAAVRNAWNGSFMTGIRQAWGTFKRKSRSWRSLNQTVK